MILNTRKLSKTYGHGATEVKALVDITLSIKQGEFIAIMGASGSGKSTLLHLLGCLDEPNSGDLTIENEAVDSLSDKRLTMLRRRKIGFIFQFFNLIPVLTADENIGLPLLIDGQKMKVIQPLIDEILKITGLTERRNHYPDELSGGQQQRVAIGRALITKPAIILADEPTGNLDSVTGKEIMKLLRHSCDQLKQTIILVTHAPKDAVFADRIIFLKDGLIADETVPEEKISADVIADKLQEISDFKDKGNR